LGGFEADYHYALPWSCELLRLPGRPGEVAPGLVPGEERLVLPELQVGMPLDEDPNRNVNDDDNVDVDQHNRIHHYYNQALRLPRRDCGRVVGTEEALVL